jgi:hypothetical protein
VYPFPTRGRLRGTDEPQGRTVSAKTTDDEAGGRHGRLLLAPPACAEPLPMDLLRPGEGTLGVEIHSTLQRAFRWRVTAAGSRRRARLRWATETRRCSTLVAPRLVPLNHRGSRAQLSAE